MKKDVFKINLFPCKLVNNSNLITPIIEEELESALSSPQKKRST
jgi:hypothetical protein